MEPSCTKPPGRHRGARKPTAPKALTESLPRRRGSAGASAHRRRARAKRRPCGLAVIGRSPRAQAGP